MVIGKIFTKLIQALPTWEVTKYYGRVCIYQMKCLKYRIQTSEAWFNFKCKFMPGSLRDEAECEEVVQKVKDKKCKEKDERIKKKHRSKDRSHSSKVSLNDYDRGENCKRCRETEYSDDQNHSRRDHSTADRKRKAKRA